VLEPPSENREAAQQAPSSASNSRHHRVPQQVARLRRCRSPGGGPGHTLAPRSWPSPPIMD